MIGETSTFGCEFCRNLPKVELHAHLSGSYSIDTIKKLSNKPIGDLDWLSNEFYGFDEVFKYFSLAQAATNSQEAVYTGAVDVIDEFKADNVRYLELRTTPKNDGSMTPSEYAATVVRAIEEAEYKNTNSEDGQTMVVKLILSIDRRRSMEAAATALKLATEYRRHVVAIDLSGDPRFGDARSFLPILREAQLSGFKLALHLAEKEGLEEETAAVLSALRPDRIGHGTFIRNSLAETVQKAKIPLELCVTSNIALGTVSSVDDHHLQYWHDLKHPVAICTDDKGPLRTTLSRELHIAHSHLRLAKADVAGLAKSSFDAAFLSSGNSTTAEWNCFDRMIKTADNIAAGEDKGR